MMPRFGTDGSSADKGGKMQKELLGVFIEHPTTWLSGADLAAALGVSRSAVWKQIEGLRAQGVAIEAAPRKGYRLSAEANLLTAESVAQALPAGTNIAIEGHGLIDSTNKRAVALAGEGAPAWQVVLADAQSAGSGRRGRDFYSPAGVGIYMSVILRPKLPAQEATLLTMAAAVAVAEAAEAFSGEPLGIKWVNDVYRGQRKIAGILTEAALSLEEKSLRWAVVGMGLNVFPQPTVGASVYGSLFDDRPADPLLRARLAADILSRLQKYLAVLADRPYLEGYRRRLFFLGKPADLVEPQGRRTVLPVDIDDMGHLIVENSDGQREVVATGEISLRPHELGG